jgi:hypothetical protein
LNSWGEEQQGESSEPGFGGKIIYNNLQPDSTTTTLRSARALARAILEITCQRQSPPVMAGIGAISINDAASEVADAWC